MIKSILKIAVLMVAVVAGGVGASFYKSVSAEDASAGHVPEVHGKNDKGHGAKSDTKDSHGKAKKEDKKAKADKGHKSNSKGGGHGKSSDSGGTTYLKFKRQFVIPVMAEKKIKSLVIMNFNLELNDHAPSNSFNLEPKLRDAFMRDLLNLSNEGVFSGDITSPENFEYIRETLLGSSRRILNDGVDNILILDIAKRDN